MEIQKKKLNAHSFQINLLNAISALLRRKKNEFIPS